jgi:L-ascorbate metabolism protein UlaG (beta-lactamase superfamily)
MQVTSIANAGFLINASKKKILIDALFGGFEADWCVVPSSRIVEKMETGAAPFDHIDVILVSHAHMDHFNAEIVIQHLINNETGILICPEQVRLELEKDGRYAKLSPRIKEITPAYGTGSQSIEVKGIEIKVWGLKHSAYYIESEETGKKYNKHENVQNLSFTIAIDHQKIFHGGDWGVDGMGAEPNPLNVEKIDLAFLDMGAYLALFGPGANRMDESRKPEHVVLMHIPPTVDVDELTEEEKQRISAETSFQTPMQTMEFGD